MKKHNIEQLFDEIDKLKSELENDKQLYQVELNKLFSDFTNAKSVSVKNKVNRLDDSIIMDRSVNDNISDIVIDDKKEKKIKKNKKDDSKDDMIKTRSTRSKKKDDETDSVVSSESVTMKKKRVTKKKVVVNSNNI